jgi:TonB-dependent receptor
MGVSDGNQVLRRLLMTAVSLPVLMLAGGAAAQTAAPQKDAAQSTAPRSGPQSVPAGPPAGSQGGVSEDAVSQVDEIVVTGIRGSLQSSTNAKRDSVVFQDSIYAEDIGKLPATNLAETLQRIPGVVLNRDIDGEGTQVSIRGLGPSFSKVLLNGANVAVASDGGTNGGNGNREVDLDLFPSELFTKLEVQKSPTAATLEGGIAGTVNLHQARPFDKPGQHLTVVAQGQYDDSDGKLGPRGALVASKTWDNFGILVGVAGVKAKTRVDGFETIGWTDGDVKCGGCGVGTDTGNGFQYASVMPRNVGFGFTPGAPVDLAATSGLSLPEISNAKLPRLGRNSLTIGDRSRVSAILSAEYQPNDQFHFALDGMWAKSVRDFQRLNMNWYVRNSGPGTSPTSTGGMVPIDVHTDANGIVTSGTFANSSFFLENDVFNQTTKFWNLNPTMVWKPRDGIEVDAQVNYGHSTFFREQPQFDFQTPAQSGVTAFYQQGGKQPIITTNVDLNDPNLGWNWYRVNVQNVERKTTTKGAHFDVILGDRDSFVKVGGAYDNASRSIRAFDNSTAFQTAVCGATCDGLSGSVPNSQVSQFLNPMSIHDFGHLAGGNVGYTSWIMPNLKALEQATNYAAFRDSAPETRSAVTGGATGDISEKTFGGYAEVGSVAQVLDRDLRMDFGVRYFHTEQKVAGPVQVAAGLIDVVDQGSYNDFLPSANLTYDVTSRLKLRFSASRTMTRPDASQLLPGTTFSDISAQIASTGNPNLRPYTSNNIDVGGEFYTGGIGYIGVALFRKDVDGFTATTQTTEPFTALGIPFADLQTSQQQALMLRGGPDVATVTVSKPVNLDKLLLQGVELTWVQPLDFVVKGLGFSANGTYIKQSSQSDLFAPGIAPYTYNLQGFYEGYGVSVSLNWTWQDKMVTLNAPQNNINVPLIADAHGQLDLSASYQLPMFNTPVRLTFDAQNLTNAPLRTVFGYDSAPYSVYYPGRQIIFGVRASF